MNIIFAKHDNEKECCFEVMKQHIRYIRKGDFLLVEINGNTEVVKATTNVISGLGAKDIAEKSGAYFPLRRVISFVDDNIKKYMCDTMKKLIINTLDSNSNITREMILGLVDLNFEDELPF